MSETSSQPYAAGLDISQGGAHLGDVSVSSHSDPRIGARLRLAVLAHGALATVSLPLTPLELRELAGALRLAADHTDEARRGRTEAPATSASSERIDTCKGADDDAIRR